MRWLVADFKLDSLKGEELGLTDDDSAGRDRLTEAGSTLYYGRVLLLLQTHLNVNLQCRTQTSFLNVA